MTKSFEKRTWKDVLVGDIIKVYEREIFPADLLFLRSDNTMKPRSCFVNTKSMDGETDNKYRRALMSTAGTAETPKLCTMDEIASLTGRIICELPNSKTNDFSGSLHNNVGELLGPIDCNSVLLRGCMLRNTKWIYGVVITTGKDCKIEYQENESSGGCGINVSSVKNASINKQISKHILSLVVILLVLCVWIAIGSFLWSNNSPEYLELPQYNNYGKIVHFIQVFFTAFLLNYQFIPVSLYVSMSLVYGLQSFFMTKDINMYYHDEDEPLRVQSSTLNNELGQVGYVFSDKTGTLTSNLMEFRKVSIGGINYGSGVTEISIARMRAMGQDTKKAEAIIAENLNKPKRYGCEKYCNFTDGSDDDFNRSLFKDAASDTVQATRIREFCLNMALNHTVFVDELNGEKDLSASSPDEQAFVSAAMHFGFTFLYRNLETGTATFRTRNAKGFDEETEVEILGVLEYTNFRKRMSVIVGFPNGRIVLYGKGADNVMYERLRNDEDEEIASKTAGQVGIWAEDAFRTMVFGFKNIDETEYNNWRNRLSIALSKEKEVRKKKEGVLPNEIDDLYEEMENGMTLQGATAIEDKLQDGVPTTLKQLDLLWRMDMLSLCVQRPSCQLSVLLILKHLERTVL